jgi:hypothetical protein
VEPLAQADCRQHDEAEEEAVVTPLELILIALLAADTVWLLRVLGRERAVRRLMRDARHECAKILREAAQKIERR